MSDLILENIEAIAGGEAGPDWGNHKLVYKPNPCCESNRYLFLWPKRRPTLVYHAGFGYPVIPNWLETANPGRNAKKGKASTSWAKPVCYVVRFLPVADLSDTCLFQVRRPPATFPMGLCQPCHWQSNG